MRNHRLFGVVIAVLLGLSCLHFWPGSPHIDDQASAGTHFGGAGIQLASATLTAAHEPSPLALGEESPIGLLQPVGTEHRLGDIQLASTPALVSPVSGAGGDEIHIGLLRPAGTRYVKLMSAWMAYQEAHTPPPPPPPPPPPAPKLVVATPVVHHAAVPAVAAPPVAPVTSAASGGAWAALRQCESGGNYADNTGNGYYGAYQFAAGTWHGLGYTGLPSAASPAVQDQAARQLQARSGWGQWPACSRRLGLT
jgi:hypothetical protein